MDSFPLRRLLASLVRLRPGMTNKEDFFIICQETPDGGQLGSKHEPQRSRNSGRNGRRSETEFRESPCWILPGLAIA